MPIITIVILVNSSQDDSRLKKTRLIIHRFVAYNDNDSNNDNDNYYSMKCHGMKIIS